ncbi:MAG TPA: hypothetical protein VE011_03455 [Candidatus Dormibacteraeota bacterium]|nr:hypothetical protein [Candidatus Dormibacteraeota bacterium]
MADRKPEDYGMRRRYWTERQGFGGDRLDLEEATRLFASVIGELAERDLLQKWFGYECVDAGTVAGQAGGDVEAFVYRKTRRRDLWPIAERFAAWDEGAFFTAVEFMHDHVSFPTAGDTHTWRNCGFHASAFDDDEGKRLFREEINGILADYAGGFELRADGEIVRSAPEELAELLDEPTDARASADVKKRVAEAIRKFRHRTATASDRKDAVRDLADVVELLCDRASGVLETADERDLFQLANKFGLRHANDQQKDDFDQSIWYDWMFFYYLASIRAFTRLEGRQPSQAARIRAAGPSLPISTRVRHVRWGLGIVVASRATRSDVEVTVAFRDPEVGRKTLLASLAGLEILS